MKKYLQRFLASCVLGRWMEAQVFWELGDRHIK